MDTDCAYFAISGQSLKDFIILEYVVEFNRVIQENCNSSPYEASTTNWFPRECCTKHAQHDKRQSGLFKLEAEGQEIIALCSKTYVLKTDNNFKLTCKGINKNCVTEPLQIFQNVLNSKNSFAPPEPNRGFRARDNTMFSYTQSRNGFGYFYCKRMVCDDGIHTHPLALVLSPWPD
jgi:hypothetical protein